MRTSLVKILKLALLGGALALGAARSADAGYVVINADPAFGPAFPSMGWRAIGAIFVPDDCLATLPNSTNAVVFRPETDGPCAAIRMQDVKVGFYDLVDPGTIVEVLAIGSYAADLTPPADSADDMTQKLLDIEFDASKLVSSFHTSLSLTVQAFSPIAGAGANHFSLEFSSGGARLVAFGEPNAPFSDRIGQSIAPENTIATRYTSDVDYRAPSFATQAVPVPEPASLALTLAALTAAFGVGRRGRQSRSASAERSASSMFHA